MTKNIRLLSILEQLWLNEKIDKIIRERQSKLYASYCMTRNILIGVIAMSTLLLYEPFWEIYKELLNFFSW